MEKLELELVNDHDSYCVCLIATLTGYETEEIAALRTNNNGGFRSGEFRDIFQKLGYSCNNRFIKFDPETEHVSLLRARPKVVLKYKHWFAIGYNDHKIYIPGHPIINEEMFFSTLWGDEGHQMQITSMINIWL